MGFFLPPRAKIESSRVAGDMANIFAPSTDHVTRHENHMIDRQCGKVTTQEITGPGFKRVDLADGGKLQGLRRKVDFTRSP